MKLSMKLILAGIAVLSMAGFAGAQTTRGQFYLPGGGVPQTQIRFSFERADGQMHEVRFSDSNGRFVLERLDGQQEYVITVDGNDVTHGTTIYRFVPSQESSLRIYLSEPPRKKLAKPDTVSAASHRGPAPAALKSHKEAVRKVQEDKLDEAEKLFKQAIIEDPKFPEPLFALGGVYIQQKKLTEAEKVIRQGLELDAKSAYGQMSLGMVLVRTNRYQEAVTALREALRLNRDLASAHLYLGIALTETEQFEEAERLLSEADNVIGPEEALRHMYLGQVYARTGRYEKSIASFDTYLLKMPAAKNAADVRALIQKMKLELARPR